ncbi:hypothetical protein Nepgr_025348 [Nepenthes gracilis]|uniref:Uncharacterized protein n=1 Tax=Nepenthes gracilis TaxID=150966 RepID=A0AAD3Y0Z3_NEPGR|nr:hypothetical protein Nepgr_025348 [Nepenthes gracilis]
MLKITSTGSGAGLGCSGANWVLLEWWLQCKYCSAMGYQGTQAQSVDGEPSCDDKHQAGTLGFEQLGFVKFFADKASEIAASGSRKMQMLSMFCSV